MRQFSFAPTVRLIIFIQQIISVLGLFISFGITTLLLWGTGRVEVNSPLNLLDDPRLTLICIGIWTLIIGLTISLTLINAYPTIWMGEAGIAISAFIFFKIYIPWSEIIDLKIGVVRFGHDLVRVKRISVFHRIYGWLYSHTLYASFIIRKDIKDRNILVSEIQRRIQNN